MPGLALTPHRPSCLARTRYTTLAGFIVLLFAFSGCGGGPQSAPAPPPVTENPTPSVSGLSPSSAVVGSSQQIVTIAGSGFLSSSSVSFNGSNHAATLLSAQQLSIALDQNDLATVGSFPVVVTNPAPGGGSSAPAHFQVNAAGLTVNITDLPPGALAKVTVTGPGGVNLTLASSQTITGPAGTYTITAAGVSFGSNRYFATVPTQTAVLPNGGLSTVTVDYFTVIASTTKVLDELGMQSLSLSPDGTALTISVSSALAQSLSPGDILASSPTASAPNGLLVKILTVSQGAGTVTAAIAQATMVEAIAQADFTFTQTFGATNTLTKQGARPLSLEKAREAGIVPRASSLTDSCAGNANTFVVPFAETIGADGTVQQGSLGADAEGIVGISGQLELCPALSIELKWSFLSLNSLTAVATFGEHAQVTVEGQLTSSVAVQKDLTGLGLKTDPVLVVIGDVPFLLEGQVIPFVGLTGEAQGGFYSSAEQDAKAQLGLTYSNGTTTPISSATFAWAPGALSLDQLIGVKGFAGLKLGLLIDGFLLPNIQPDAYLEWTANPQASPWWQLNWGLEGAAGVELQFLDDSAVSLSTPTVMLSQDKIAQAPGPFANSDVSPVLSGTSPSSAAAGSPSITLQLTGSNFVPDSVVQFNATALATTFVDPAHLTALLPANGLTAPGAFSIIASNPDSTGALSGPLSFTITSPQNSIPSLTTVSPATVSVGTFTLSLTGTNFLPTSQVFFGTTQLSTQFVSSTQLTATGTATTSQVGSVLVTVVNPPPGGGTSNSQLVTVVNTSTSSSGSTGILTETVNGQTVDVAYVPQPFQSTIAVVNVDSISPTTALVTTIPLPSGYQPNATAVNPATSVVVVISYGSPVMYLIDAKQNTLLGNFTVPVTAFAGYSGGSCQICGVVIDAASNNAILDTAQGTMLFNLNTNQFGKSFPNLAAENFAYNPNTQTALLPTYDQSSFAGLQTLNLSTGLVAQLSTSVGAEPDSATIDLTTGLAVVPDENTATEYIVNMQQATYSGITFTAPSSSFVVNAPVCAPFWTLASIENVSHLLFLGTEFDGCLGAAPLPASAVPGAPPTPASLTWGRMPNAPDGNSWNNGADPHGIAVFTSVVDGKAYGFLVDSNGPWVAKIDLKGLAGAAPLTNGSPNQVDPTPFVTFLRTQ